MAFAKLSRVGVITTPIRAVRFQNVKNPSLYVAFYIETDDLLSLVLPGGLQSGDAAKGRVRRKLENGNIYKGSVHCKKHRLGRCFLVSVNIAVRQWLRVMGPPSYVLKHLNRANRFNRLMSCKGVRGNWQ